jgi:hypothetical protein
VKEKRLPWRWIRSLLSWVSDVSCSGKHFASTLFMSGPVGQHEGVDNVDTYSLMFHDPNIENRNVSKKFPSVTGVTGATRAESTVNRGSRRTLGFRPKQLELPIMRPKTLPVLRHYAAKLPAPKDLFLHF